MIGRRWALRVGILGAGLAVGVSGGTTVASWTSKVDTPTGTVQAIADWVAPTISDVRVLKAEGGTPGFVRPGGEFRVCSTVGPDSGRPASGLAGVTTDLTSLAASLLAPLLGSPAPCPASSNQDSGVKGLPAGASTGTRTISLTARDNAGNARTETASVMVDGTRPRAVGITTTNGGTTATSVTKPDPGDTITFSFDEPIERQSLGALTWTNDAAPVVVCWINTGTGGRNDTFQLRRGACDATGTVIPLTTTPVDTGRNFVTASVTFAATLRVNAAGDAFTVRLDSTTATATATRQDTGTTAALAWTPGAVYDRAGNQPAAAAPDTAGPDF